MTRCVRSTMMLILLIPLSLAPAALAAAQDQVPQTFGLRELNEQSVLALAWMQGSAEYRELCYQAFNLADILIDKALSAAKPGDKPLAIVSDLDETLLDNSAFDAGFIGKNDAFAGKSWTQWENAALARGVPGAAEFLSSVASRGVEIFYVTNRDQAGLPGTLRNLQALGFPFADAVHVLVSEGSSDKQPRFDRIARDHTVVVFMGDNANDLPIGTWHKDMKARNEIVDQNKALFGSRFIALPNPSYGDWEGALAGGYYKLPPWGRSEARKSVLQTWTAPR